MCLAVFSHLASAAYSLVFAANRDELHERPTAPAGWWNDHATILGGRDLKAGGSWLAVDRRGRLAAVTNFRDGGEADYPRSRGGLVQDYLTDSISADDYLATLKAHEGDYGPYNLVIFDGRRLHYASNRAPGQELGAGVYALSNTLLGSTWPKVRHAEATLSACLDDGDPDACLFGLLADETRHDDLPATAERATRLMSTVFIKDERYGTRSSTVILLSRHGELRFTERRFGANGVPLGQSSEQFKLAGSAASD
ncbi:MAG: NRDE family protein [Gammaproteobacteria bacterium]|nr:NRDE family protein [Gammaproteobacteria bacterium]